MTRLHVFADEAGNFDFRRADNVSRYFVVCTVVMPSCEAANHLLELKRRLAWEQQPLGDYFHATADAQAIRDAVFAELIRHDFTVQATILDKWKAAPQTRTTDATFYQYGWFYHFLYGLRTPLRQADEVHVTAASIGTKKGQAVFTEAVRKVVKQLAGKQRMRTSFWPCQSDPCLQLTDYCTWAIQRKWERADTRAYDIIADRITYEYDTFRKGTTLYY
ncbi:DUF3800 domain-containing protein [Sphingomonas sp. A2-49]|uniref:DUF3800 domain-containing protein n=1 Tax=Sphingomonas sp. A2-49 TaxID=1391375 RepID=UPI0021D0F9E3|nr:DUF3800 domain-containing protein [Sphingomonas sp. A2-49]MCU6453810.1 DUF3800 domain-containing protein [Sphingomonas sp. A2-49]